MARATDAARFALKLQWMMTAPDDNSGVFVAFPHPEHQGYDNTAFVGVHLGFEIQIDGWGGRTARRVTARARSIRSRDQPTVQ